MARKRPPFAKPPEPITQRSDSEAIVAAIVAAAIELGPEAPLASVARRAGVGTASLHRYFPTSTALFAEIARQMFRTVLEQIRAITAEPRVTLPTLVHELCRAALAGPNVSVEYRRRLNLEIPLSWSKDTAEVIYVEMFDILIGWMRRNVPNPPDDLEARVFVAFGAVRGAVIVSLLFPALAPPEEKTLELLTSTVLSALTS